MKNIQGYYFKTFQVYSSFGETSWKPKLLKFQNFSSLQFIKNYKEEFKKLEKFQNFSSLQFIKIFNFVMKETNVFQNFSSLQFITLD